MIRIIRALLVLLCAMHATAWARGGQVDAMFGNDGVVNVQAADNYLHYEFAMLPDGRMLVAHSVEVSTDLFMYRGDGTVDTSFGRAGVLNLPDVSVAALVAQPDGRIVVASTRDTMKDVTFMRLRADGSIDTTFGTGGKAIYPFEYYAFVPKMRLLADGSLVAAVGSLYNFASEYASVVKLTPAGAFDAAYGTAGVVDRAFFYITNAGTIAALDVRILDDGRVEFLRTTTKSIVKSRLNADGSLDTSLGAAGVLSQDTILPAGTYGSPLIAALLDDGGVLAYVVVPAPDQTPYQPDTVLEVSHYGADLTLDRAFGTAGIASFRNAPGTFAGRTTDGGYVFAGGSLVGLQLLKLTGAGAVDTAFGVNGIAPVRLPVAITSAAGVRRPLLRPDGSVMILATNPVNTGLAPGPVRAYVVKAQAVGDIVEFRNSLMGHYFMTYDADEARGIDAGVAGPGWSRTGGSFKPGGTTPVCRFYGTPGVGPNSHFFTASADECETVKHAPGWTYEGLGFYTTPPVSGQCAAPLVPVHRLYNNRAAQNDSNHRFVTDTALIPAMEAKGWVHEGVVFCAKG